MGNSSSDSQLDVLLSSHGHPDRLVDIICKHDNPTITSSHDLIISRFNLTPKLHQPDPTPGAPRVIKLIFRVVWDNSTIPLYSSILQQSLLSILASCGDSPSHQAFASLLNRTHKVILQAARKSFTVKSLSLPLKSSKPKADPTVKRLSILISQLSAKIRKESNPENLQELKKRRSILSHSYTKAVRRANFRNYMK